MSVSTNTPPPSKDISPESAAADQEALSSAAPPVPTEVPAENLGADSQSKVADAVTEASHQISASVPLTEKDKAFILKQIEFYFSDINLPNDKFLRGKVLSNHDGFVDLAIILSFKKMQPYKAISKQVAEILRSSDELIISEDGLKVRRTTKCNLDHPRYIDFIRRTLAFKGVPEENKEAFLDGFVEFLREILEAAFADSGVTIAKHFARIDNYRNVKDSPKLKSFTYIMFLHPEYAQVLLGHFQEVPCVYESVPIQVFSRGEILIDDKKYITPFPAERILKVTGFSDRKASVKFHYLQNLLGDTIYHFGFSKGQEVGQASSLYLAVKSDVDITSLKEKIAGEVIPKNHSEATKESNNAAEVTVAATNLGATGVAHGNTSAAPNKSLLGLLVQVAENEGVNEAAKEAVEIKEPVADPKFVVEVPSESDVAEARLIFKFAPFCPFGENSYPGHQKKAGFKRGRGKQTAHPSKRSRNA